MPNGSSHIKNLEGYKSLFEDLYPPLCLFANKYLNDMDASKDIVQEVFIKIWEQQIVFANPNTTKAYFYTTVKNHCLNYLKGKYFKIKANAVSLNDLELQQSEDYLYSQLVATETYAQLYKAIDTLPKKAAKVITLSLNKYSINEIAEELDITPSTVRTHKSLAYQKLKMLLGPLKYLFSIFSIYF